MRAVIRFHPKRITVLCARGHLITSRETGRHSGFAGSAFEAELGAHAHGQPNTFDRQSADCWACKAQFGHIVPCATDSRV